MFVKGGQISERGAKFPSKYGPRGGPYFLGNLARGGPYFGGAKFPGTPGHCLGLYILCIFCLCIKIVVNIIIYKWYGLNGVNLHEYDGVKLSVFSIIFTMCAQ